MRLKHQHHYLLYAQAGLLLVLTMLFSHIFFVIQALAPSLAGLCLIIAGVRMLYQVRSQQRHARHFLQAEYMFGGELPRLIFCPEIAQI